MSVLNHPQDVRLGLGTWLSIGSSVVAELVSQFPFDWLLYDLEHGSSPESTLPDQLRAGANMNTRAIVRVPALQPATIARVLDWGADGIMLPHVSSAEQAAQCVSAMYYAPKGNRGYSTTVRAYGYGLKRPEDLDSVQPFCIAQIEDVEGVRNASEIAAVEGVHVLFVGPGDLNLALSHQRGDNIINFETAVRQVADAAKQHGKQAGILLRNPSDLAPMKQLGYSCIAIDSDLAILRKGYADIISNAAQTET
ncbi:HpcH/HpaI aldolase family protein [Sphingobacterium haloxyli]|uniref:HpcH/HpaI aldolase/citrate lyase domain-containing protein n=1 Tax=Sphingobacterium haloxyli TaxID=2100533 RepID=A0A2S9J7K4_9SPHI|nr:aldolase/citrate lyase family protein [Sphingobacterium haloxyli]PRD48752.1 hypothetical protein C5745_02075 [Sphingobacterium haloxyli]